MNVRNFSLVLALVAFSASSVFAQTGTFSFLENSLEIAAGGSGSVVLTYTGDSIDTGFNFDLLSSTPGTIAFTGFDLFNNTAGAGGLDRFSGVNAGTVDADSVLGVSTVNLPPLTQNVGIDSANAGLDADFDGNVFLIGELSFDVIGAEGSSTVISFNDAQAVNAGAPLTLDFGTATVTVGVPEPTSAGLLAMGLVGLVARRRR